MSVYFGRDLTADPSAARTTLIRAFPPPSTTAAPVDPNAAAQAELARLLQLQAQAEQDAAMSGAYDEPEDNTLKYVGIGAGALALLGLLAVVLKKKRGKALKGYRRRRKR